jgi:hypothetical protein
LFAIDNTFESRPHTFETRFFGLPLPSSAPSSTFDLLPPTCGAIAQLPALAGGPRGRTRGQNSVGPRRSCPDEGLLAAPRRGRRTFRRPTPPGPTGALPRHTITRKRPKNIHPFAPRPVQPCCASPEPPDLFARALPWRPTGSSSRRPTTTWPLRRATRVTRSCSRARRARISSSCSRSRRNYASVQRKQTSASARRGACDGSARVRVRCTVCQVGGARLIALIVIVSAHSSAHGVLLRRTVAKVIPVERFG